MQKTGQFPKPVDDYRVIEAKVHFNPRDSRARQSRRYLGLLTSLVGRALHEAAAIIQAGLSIERDKDDLVARVELRLPLTPAGDEDAARSLLDPNRRRKRGDFEEREEPDKEPTARQLAAPKYANPYRLVGITERENAPPSLRFALCETYLFRNEEGKEEKARTSIPSLYLQALLRQWVRAPAFGALPMGWRDGCAQDLAQQILSHLGLLEEGSQPSVGLPQLWRGDFKEFRHRRNQNWSNVATAEELKMRPAREVHRGRFAADDPQGDELVCTDDRWREALAVDALKRQSQRLTGIHSFSLHLRRWHEADGRRRVGLYLALPFPTARGIGDTSPLRRFVEQVETPGLNFFWWRKRLDEFQPLPPWKNKGLTEKSRRLLVPLSFDGSLRRLRRKAGNLEDAGHGDFLRTLMRRRVCWALIVERAGEFYLQLAVHRLVTPVARPNLLAVLPVQIETLSGTRTSLCWAYLARGETAPAAYGSVPVDFLPRSGQWPDRKNRRRLAYRAARVTASLADDWDADLALVQTGLIFDSHLRARAGQVKKRTADSEANARATRFNYADLMRRVADKALDLERPVRTLQISGWHLKDAAGWTFTEAIGAVIKAARELRGRLGSAGRGVKSGSR